MKKFRSIFTMLSVIVCSAFTFCVHAQTYAYKYSHSVKDGVKVSGIPAKGTVFYFTFTNGGSMCYHTDAQGVYSSGYGAGSYRFIGTKNGMHVYQEQNRNGFRKIDGMLYFSEDFSKMNWLCNFDMFSQWPGCLRVLNYVSDPDEVEIPDRMY